MKYHTFDINRDTIYDIREETFAPPFEPLTESQKLLFYWRYTHPTKYVSQRVRGNDGVHGGYTPKVF